LGEFVHKNEKEQSSSFGFIWDFLSFSAGERPDRGVHSRQVLPGQVQDEAEVSALALSAGRPGAQAHLPATRSLHNCPGSNDFVFFGSGTKSSPPPEARFSNNSFLVHHPLSWKNRLFVTISLMCKILFAKVWTLSESGNIGLTFIFFISSGPAVHQEADGHADLHHDQGHS
jgi:hypothetical protein